MLRLTIECVPHGIEAQKVTLGVVEIVNDGRGDTQVGHYVVHSKDRAGQVEQRTTVAGHQRIDGWKVLVGKALERLLEKRS